MPKKAKKRKHKKSSSSSSEEDERISRGQYASNSYKTAKRKEVLKSQKSCKKDKEKSVSSSVKDDSQSTRQIKKPVYRLAKTQATEQKPVNKDRQYAKCKPDFLAFHRDRCSSKAKNYVSGKDKTVTGSDIVERGYSKLRAGAVPQRTETKSKGGFDERSSQRSQSKLNKPRVGPSLVSAEVKEPRQDVQKRNCRTEDPPRTGNHSRYIKTSKPTSSTSAIEMCQKHEKKELKPQRSFYKDDANTSSASILKKSSTSAKHSASESSSKMQVVEELHLARSEKRLEVNVLKSYGELTAMDIDYPEEGPAGKKSSQQDLILVLDTNILLSHLDYVKKIRCHGLGGLGFPIIVIPWVVLQEIDSLKMGRGLSGSVAHLATPAISYIYKCLKSREPRLWGQSMQQAAESSNGLTAENNDDRVLQCCLQYQRLFPECALTLCTNDKNLCSKALLSGVKALCKTDLEEEVGRSRHGLQITGDIQASVPPRNNPQVLSPTLSMRCPPVQPHGQKKADFYVGVLHKDSKQLSEGDEERTVRDLSGCISALEDCLREVLSEVLQVEMKAAYDDLWLEIVYLKPPWTLQDVLQCIKKHWIAVFGHLIHRKKEQTVLKLIKFFNSGETVEREAISEAVQDAKDLVNAFSSRSKRVPRAVAVLDDILNKLRPQPNLPTGGESPASDVVMNDDDDSGDSHQEVWAVFERIWSHVCQLSLEVFKALGFDPHTRQCLQPEGAAPPPQDALACLHKLSSMVSQLLQAFSSVLLSAPGLEEVQTLLSIINSNNIVTETSRLTAKGLLDCFSQPDYREKLRVGGTKLMELQEALEHCVQAAGQYTTFPT